MSETNTGIETVPDPLSFLIDEEKENNDELVQIERLKHDLVEYSKQLFELSCKRKELVHGIQVEGQVWNLIVARKQLLTSDDQTNTMTALETKKRGIDRLLVVATAHSKRIELLEKTELAVLTDIYRLDIQVAKIRKQLEELELRVMFK